MTNEQRRMLTAIDPITVRQQPPRKREFLWMGLVILLGYAYLSDLDFRDHQAVEEAKQKIELSLQACQRAIRSADKHARILAEVMNKGGAIIVDGNVEAICQRARYKVERS